MKDECSIRADLLCLSDKDVLRDLLFGDRSLLLERGAFTENLHCFVFFNSNCHSFQPFRCFDQSLANISQLHASFHYSDSTSSIVMEKNMSAAYFNTFFYLH